MAVQMTFLKPVEPLLRMMHSDDYRLRLAACYVLAENVRQEVLCTFGLAQLLALIVEELPSVRSSFGAQPGLFDLPRNSQYSAAEFEEALCAVIDAALLPLLGWADVMFDTLAEAEEEQFRLPLAALMPESRVRLLDPMMEYLASCRQGCTYLSLSYLCWILVHEFSLPADLADDLCWDYAEFLHSQLFWAALSDIGEPHDPPHEKFGSRLAWDAFRLIPVVSDSDLCRWAIPAGRRSDALGRLHEPILKELDRRGASAISYGVSSYRYVYEEPERIEAELRAALRARRQPFT